MINQRQKKGCAARDLSGADGRKARRRDGNDLSQAPPDPGSGRAQQCIQVGHNFVPGAFTQAVGPEINALS